MKKRSIASFNLSTALSATMLLVCASFATPAMALPLGVFQTGWTDFTSNAPEDCLSNCNQVYPGYGGQRFDAEYLFYQMSGNQLSIGLQAGYDLVDGQVSYGGRNYYAGDLWLNINGVEYGVDFGLETRDYNGVAIDIGSPTPAGIDAAGLYSNTNWAGNLAFGASAPFAMDAGTLVSGGLLSQSAGQSAAGDTLDDGLPSYYRIVTLDLGAIGIAAGDAVDFMAHWTMSCGNDAIDGRGSVSVPEPATITLLGLGLLGLGFARRRKVAAS